MNPIEFRAAQVADVSFPKRTIELVVMPYEEEAAIEYRGRMVREVVSRGAFDGIERRANRVKVNLNHDVTQGIGKALTFHPGRSVGLVAECLISRRPEGDGVLQDAEDGMLDASAGFAPIEQRWEAGGTVRRIDKAWLAHIALVSEPAYQGARVLAVRSAAEAPAAPAVALATPNLDRVRAWRLEAEYDRLGR